MAVFGAMRTVNHLVAALLAGAVLACGDIGALRLDVTFPNEDLELRTRALRVVVREGPMDGSPGCAALWGTPMPMLSEEEAVVAYPNRDDVLAAAVRIDYESLSLLVYGHPGLEEVEGDEGTELAVVGEPLVGGCVDQPIEDPGITTALEVPLLPAP